MAGFRLLFVGISYILCITLVSDGSQSVGSIEQQEITWGKPNTDTARFDENNPLNVTAMVGQQAILPCTVIHLDKKDVSWIRQRDLHILTR
ncbi:uncharacterized protein [Palaemon carinicauda]|uniref:uncharacterized protein isoform X2 n=1 Tax=Palaemon carinicauda TaxID=392227 RepID=UPI0035B658F8